MGTNYAFLERYTITTGVSTDTFQRQNIVYDSREEFIPTWLSDDHPFLTVTEVDTYIGVGIKDGKRAIIFNHEGNISYCHYPTGKNLYDLVIICPDEFNAELQPLQQHKENNGIKTVIVTLSNISNRDYFSGIGNDEAEKIKEEGIPPQPPVPSLPTKEVKQRCQKARHDLLVIQSRAQLRERDEKGNVRYVSEKEKEQRVKAAKRQIKEYCN